MKINSHSVSQRVYLPLVLAALQKRNQFTCYIHLCIFNTSVLLRLSQRSGEIDAVEGIAIRKVGARAAS